MLNNRLVDIITQLVVQEKCQELLDNPPSKKRMERIKYLADQYFRETGTHYRFPTAEEGQHYVV